MEMRFPDSLPVPPADGLVKMSYEEGMLRIDLKAVFAPWIKVMYVLLLPLMFVCIGVVAACVGKMVRMNAFSVRLFVPSLLAGIAGLGAYIGLLIGMILTKLRYSVVSDGKTLFVTDQRMEYAFQLDQIRGIRLALVKERSVRIRPEQSPGGIFRIAPSAALEIEGAQGRIRLLKSWEIEDLQWLVTALKAYLNLAEEKVSVADAPVVDSDALVRAGVKGPAMLFLVVGLAMVSWCGWNLYLGWASWKWPSTVGQVTEQRYEETDETHVAEMKYAFRVGGRRIESDRISYGGFEVDTSHKEIVKSHPQGSSIKVYYDPGEIERSVLIRGTDIWDWMLFSAGIVTLCGSAFLWARQPSRRQLQLARQSAVSDGRGKLKVKTARDDGMSRLFR